jgi:uncharacterized RDD family membrane protein YckC
MEPKAGFIYRWAAHVFDQLIVLPLLVVTAILFKSSNALGTIAGLLYLVYLWLATGLYGATLGKRLFNLKVVKVDGSKLGLGGAFLREVVGKFISGLVFSLGFLWAVWDKDKQTWHD